VTQQTGISNRQPPEQEARERREHPQVSEGAPPAQDASGRVGDPTGETLNGHTSHKAGSRSVAQKEDEARYPDRSMPASRKVAGAFGREPDGTRGGALSTSSTGESASNSDT
jgi:hypothetical protein